MSIEPIRSNLNWYAVQTKPRHEKTVERRLQQETVSAFLPLCTTVRQWSDRRKRVEEPLFPGYVFVQCDIGRHEHVPVLRTPGVIRFVGRGPQPEIISSSEMQEVKLWASRNMAYRERPFLCAGQKIRVKGGVMEGLSGILAKDATNEWLVLSVGALDHSIEVKVTGYEYEIL